jgi:hypothetical protein
MPENVERHWVDYYDIYHLESDVQYTPRNRRGQVANIMECDLGKAFTLKGGENTIRVRAAGNVRAGLVLNSDWVEMKFTDTKASPNQTPVIVESTAPQAPTNLRAEGQKLLWDAHVPNNPNDEILGYDLKFYRNGRLLFGTNPPAEAYYDLAAWRHLSVQFDPGNYIAMVRVSVNSGYNSSNYSDAFEFTINPSPMDIPTDLQFDGTHLTWSPVEGAEWYELEIEKADFVGRISTSTTNSFYLPQGMLPYPYNIHEIIVTGVRVRAVQDTPIYICMHTDWSVRVTITTQS